jgi:hypothetical protein
MHHEVRRQSAVRRALVPLLLALSSGCAATRGHLTNGPATLTKEMTPTCADVVIRRQALASRWGEYLRVRMDETSAVIVGQARLKVSGRIEKQRAFFVSGRDLVLELRWANEELQVASALPRGAQDGQCLAVVGFHESIPSGLT